jgi:hypothetical protein
MKTQQLCAFSPRDLKIICIVWFVTKTNLMLGVIAFEKNVRCWENESSIIIYIIRIEWSNDSLYSF